MDYTFPITKEMVHARRRLNVSLKATTTICRKINRKRFKNALDFVEDLANEKKSIDGKYYTKSANELFKFLKILRSNADVKGVDPIDLTLFVSVHRGPTLYRSRRKRRFGIRLKVCNVQAVLKKV